MMVAVAVTVGEHQKVKSPLWTYSVGDGDDIEGEGGVFTSDGTHSLPFITHHALGEKGKER